MAVLNHPTPDPSAISGPALPSLGTPPRDGRRARGEVQRRKILEAVLTVMARDGAPGVTQRAVAREAAVSPASLLYYYSSVEAMLVAALHTVNASYLAAIEDARAAGGDPLRALAEITCAHGDGSRKLARAEFELYLLATRDRSAREETMSWWQAADTLIAGVVTDPARRLAILSLADGLSMRTLIEGDPISPDDVVQMFRWLAA